MTNTLFLIYTFTQTYHEGRLYTILYLILLQIILIALNAVFACAEIAVISMNDSKLAKLAASGDKRAIRLAKLTSQPARFLATIQVAITLSGFLGSAFAAESFSDPLVSWLISLGVKVPAGTLDVIAVVLITIVLSYFTLIFGELVPKRVAMRKAEPLALGMSALISTIARLFAPIVWFLTASTNGILRMIGIDPDAEENEVSEEEIRMMVDVGSEKGTIAHEEKQFIQNVFEFDNLTAGEIAVHRSEVAILWLEESMEEWDTTIHSNRHTCYPVCDGSADDTIGILNAKDYFRLEDQSRDSVMKHAVKPAYFIFENVRADVMFRNMKRDHCKLAVVLDEYGGMSGIVSITDLVEKLVGDLGEDEPSEGEMLPIEVLDSNTWKINGNVSLEEISKTVGFPILHDKYTTFNGLVFDSLGAVPDNGSTITFETDTLSIKLTEIQEHQVKAAIICRKGSVTPED